MATPWQPDQILFTLEGPDGRYAVVTCTDAHLGLTRNGTPISDCRWPEDQLAECIDELVRRTGVSLAPQRAAGRRAPPAPTPPPRR